MSESRSATDRNGLSKRVAGLSEATSLSILSCSRISKSTVSDASIRITGKEHATMQPRKVDSQAEAGALVPELGGQKFGITVGSLGMREITS